MKRRARSFLLAVLLTLSPAGAFQLGKPLSFGIAIDVTGSTRYVPNYHENAALIVESTLRRLKPNDTVTLYRVCDFVATVATIKVSKAKSRRAKISQAKQYKELVKAALVPCKGKGSSITKAAQMMSKKDVVLFFTDGGIRDDAQGKQFKSAAQILANRRVTWFAGLSGQRDTDVSIRDALAAQLPSKHNVILSSQLDVRNGFSEFSRRIKQARR